MEMVAGAAIEADNAAGGHPPAAPTTAAAAAIIDPELSSMAARGGDSERLKDLLLLLKMAAATMETEQAAAAPREDDQQAATLDPKLLMAARRGDSDRLKELLKLSDGNEQAGGTVAAAAPATAQVVVQVDGPAAAAPSPGADSRLLLAGVTPEGNSLLHVVAASGDGDAKEELRRSRQRSSGHLSSKKKDFRYCAEMIYGVKKVLLVARNSNGDTPLHCAAGAGNADMISCLVDLARSDGGDMAVKELLRMVNNNDETALHQAVRAASKASMAQLISYKDPELLCIPREGEKGGSPLYLAISLGEMDIARQLFDTSEAQTKKTLSYYSGPYGRNILHAAVSRSQGLRQLLRQIKDVKVDVKEGNPHISVPLLQHLTVQRDKQTGSTPLHLAASLAGWPLVGVLSKIFPHVWPGPKLATTLLLDANTSAAYQPDNEGLYPIHVAALSGSLDALRILLQRCPECTTLRDGKGRTFLHVAVEKERYWVVWYVYRMPKVLSILNAQDNEGDTALHRAVHAGNVAVFNLLIQNRRVHLDVPNKEGLTPLDLSWRMIPPRFHYRSNPRSVIYASLLLLKAPHGESRPDLFYKKHISIPDADKKAEDQKISQDLTNATQVMGIVSVLVATVTFASAFTLPGGYYQSANDGILGTPVLAGSYAFDAFILADALAFMCSCLATFSLVFAGMAAMDISIRMRCINVSFVFLKTSVRSLVAAFALGLYLALAPVAHTIAIAVCVITSAAWIYGNLEA